MLDDVIEQLAVIAILHDQIKLRFCLNNLHNYGKSEHLPRKVE